MLSIKLKQSLLFLPYILGIAALCYFNYMASAGKVVAVKDDNTIVVKDYFGKERTLRLGGGSSELSESALAYRLLDKRVQYDWVGLDKDNAVLATVTLNAETPAAVTDFAWLPETDNNERAKPVSAATTTVASKTAATTAAFYPDW